MRNISEIKAYEDEFELFELPAVRVIGKEARSGGALGNTAPALWGEVFGSNNSTIILGLPHVNVITKLEIAGGKAVATSEADGGTQVTEVSLPAVISSQVSWNEPRYPSMKGIMQAKKKPVATIDAAAADSKIKVLEYSLPPAKTAGIKIEEDPDVAAAKLADWMLNSVKVELK
jgi:hypothetical protein